MTARWGDRDERSAYPGPGVDLPVFYNDLDPNGHLNNVALGRFFEHARVVDLHAGGLPSALPGRLIVARVAVDYLAEGRLGAPLHVRTRLERVGTTSFAFGQAAWQGDACVGLAEVVVVHLHDDRPAPLTDAFRALAGRA